MGFSEKRRTTCFCLLQWKPDVAHITFMRTTSDAGKRRAALIELLGSDRRVEAVAIDGPLGPSLCALTEYRSAEALLSQGAMQKRGKPGQTSSPTGQLLHRHASALAGLALELADVADATHTEAIHPKRLVEAFPNAFLAAMMDEGHFIDLARNASDVFWRRLLESGALEALFERLLPHRRAIPELRHVTDHEERAGIVCVLTALSVARSSFVSVGDPLCGDIILPPLAAWGAGPSGEPWLRSILDNAAARVRALGRTRRGFREVRLHYCENSFPT